MASAHGCTTRGDQLLNNYVGKTDSEIPIWFQSLGNETAPAVLLVMGQGGQSISWDNEFCKTILNAGYRIIRFDNRDSGLSGKSQSDYQVGDMASDAVSVLEVLEIPNAHIVGQSMGGMIAQQIAIDHPDRVLSLSLLSTSPDVSIAAPDPRILKVSSDLEVTNESDWVEAAVDSIRVQTGSLWDFDEILVRDRITAAVERSFRPRDAMRQVQAILSSPSRTADLSGVEAPTTVIHGSEDPILPLAHGKALAGAIPHAQLVVINGMGHAVPWGHWDVILPTLLSHLQSASAQFSE